MGRWRHRWPTLTRHPTTLLTHRDERYNLKVEEMQHATAHEMHERELARAEPERPTLHKKHSVSAAEHRAALGKIMGQLPRPVDA